MAVAPGQVEYAELAEVSHFSGLVSVARSSAAEQLRPSIFVIVDAS